MCSFFMFRFTRLPIYVGTKVFGVDNIWNICVPSSQNAVVLQGRNRSMSLLDLTEPADIIPIVDTNETSVFRDLTAVSENKIAVTNGREIDFYTIRNNTLVESAGESIYVEEYCRGIDYYDQAMFVSTNEPDKILQLDMRGTKLRTLNITSKMYKSFLSYNPVTSMISLSTRLGNKLSFMTLEGESAAVIHIKSSIDSITVTETGDIYVAGREGFYKICTETCEAIEFAKGSEIAHTCITYNRKQKKLYVAWANYVEVFNTDQ